MDFLSMKSWSPYTVGILIGFLNLAALMISDKPLGASTSYVRASGMIRKLYDREYVKNNEYYLKTAPKIDWGFMLVAGIVAGAFFSSVLSGDFRLILVPPMWAAEIGTGFISRTATALAGGIILGIGSRWAGGCTSGHGISGTAQLSLLSWTASICFFIGGIVTALIIYGA